MSDININGSEVYGIIYKITNKVNGKVYIGQTTQKNGFKDRYCGKGEGVERVYNHYLHYEKQGQKINEHLKSSIEKYGFENFEVNEVFDVAYSKEELNKKEIEYIKIFNSCDKNYGYNTLEGGELEKTLKHKLNILRSQSKPLYCVETKECFLSISDFEKKYNINTGGESKILKNKNGYGKDRLHLKMITGNEKSKFILCLNNMKIYYGIKEVGKSFNFNIKNRNLERKLGINRIKKGIEIDGEQYYFCYCEDFYKSLPTKTSEENIENIINQFIKYKEGYYKMSPKEKKQYLLKENSKLIYNLIENGKSYNYVANELTKMYNNNIKFSSLNIKKFINK